MAQISWICRWLNDMSRWDRLKSDNTGVEDLLLFCVKLCTCTKFVNSLVIHPLWCFCSCVKTSRFTHSHMWVYIHNFMYVKHTQLCVCEYTWVTPPLPPTPSPTRQWYWPWGEGGVGDPWEKYPFLADNNVQWNYGWETTLRTDHPDDRLPLT